MPHKGKGHASHTATTPRRDTKIRFHDEDYEPLRELPLEIADDFMGVAIRQTGLAGGATIFLNCDEWATFLADVRSGRIK